MRRELKRVRRTSRGQSSEGRDLPTPRTTARTRPDEVATLLASIEELIG